jgi:flagellar basal body-associated protein FliL
VLRKHRSMSRLLVIMIILILVWLVCNRRGESFFSLSSLGTDGENLRRHGSEGRRADG